MLTPAAPIVASRGTGAGGEVESQVQSDAPLPPPPRTPTTGPSAGEQRLAGALHEVSNALTVVLGWLAEARAKAVPGTPLSEALEVALLHARRGHSVAREAIGARVAESTGVRSAVSVLRDVERAGLPDAMRQNVRLCLDEGPGDVQLRDWDVLLQVLVNLVLNALAFSERGANVHLSYRRRGDDAVFTVRDEGPGVPEVVRATLFAGRTSLRPGGAGIGLSHSYAMARSRGGRLALLDTDQRGACFELCWPTVEEPSQTVSQPPRDEEIAGMRVVVLEDDAAVMTMMEFGLESRGVEVVPATSEREFLSLGKDGSYDAVLMDLSPLQREPGVVLSEFHARHGAVPIVLISGTAIAADAELPLSGWVEKPFELGELYAALAALRHDASARLDSERIDAEETVEAEANSARRPLAR